MGRHSRHGGHAERCGPNRLFLKALVGTLVTIPIIVASAAPPDVPGPAGLAVLSPSRSYVEADGASLYANICQGCHMRDGQGATGAAAYPSLVANPDLQSTDYVVEVVLGGLRAMPPVGRAMSDDQIAAVVNYVRNRFGHLTDDPATAIEVKTVRGRPNE